MIISDLEKKARILESKARAKVDTLFAGEYQSAFKGGGMEVDEVRAYAYGDEVRFIDWMVTARTGDVHVKSFKEERDLTVIFAIDASASLDFGPSGRSKCDIAREVAAVLAFASFRKNDSVGLLLFSDSVELFIPPSKGEGSRARIFKALSEFYPRRKGTDIGEILRHLSRILKRRAVVFLFSDFRCADFSSALRVMSARHDLVPVWIQSGMERNLPSSGFTLIRDLESGAEAVWDTRDPRARKAFLDATLAYEKRLKSLFVSIQSDSIELSTEHDYMPELVRFFERRDRHYGSR